MLLVRLVKTVTVADELGVEQAHKRRAPSPVNRHTTSTCVSNRVSNAIYYSTKTRLSQGSGKAQVTRTPLSKITSFCSSGIIIIMLVY